MLEELATHEQLKEASDKTRLFPDFLIVHYSIRSLAEGKFLSFPARAFLHSDPSGSELFIVVRNTPNRVFTTIACIVTAKFDVDAVHKSLNDVLRRCSDWFTRGRYNLLYGIESAVNLFIGWVKERACGKDIHFTPTHLFYMTRQQMDTVSAAKQQLPEGYSIVKMDAERDAQFVTDCWKFKLPNEVIRTKETLQAIPSYAATHDASGELAAFELIDVSSGYMYHLFTMEVPEALPNALSVVRDAHEKNAVFSLIDRCRPPPPPAPVDDPTLPPEQQPLPPLQQPAPEVSIVAAYRMGPPSRDRPRLLKVVLATRSMQRAVLSASRHLRNDPQYEAIYVRPSLTAEQREAEYKLRQECRRRREAGENVRIAKGQIIQTGNAHRQPNNTR